MYIYNVCKEETGNNRETVSVAPRARNSKQQENGIRN